MSRKSTPLAASIATLVLVAAVSAQSAAPVTRPATAPAALASASTAPATQPRFGPRETPKATVLACWEAMQAGDTDGLVSCFHEPSAELVESLKPMPRIFSTVHKLELAVTDKLGAAAAAQISTDMRLGVDPADLQNAKETITGNSAIVDMGQSGPGTLELVQVGKLWKVNSAKVDLPNPQGVQRLVALLPGIENLTARVKSGEVGTAAALRSSIAALLAPPPPPQNTLP